MRVALALFTCCLLSSCGGQSTEELEPIPAIGTPSPAPPTVTPTPSSNQTPTPSVTATPIPAATDTVDGELSGGYPVVTSYQYRVGSSTENAGFYPAQFSSWSSCGADTNANLPIVSSDGKSVTFSRSIPNDGLPARACLEFEFGPSWSGNDIAISFEVSGLELSDSDLANGHLNLPDNHMVGVTSRTVSENGVFGLVATPTESQDTTTVQIGFGLNGEDTRTNSITISKLMFAHLSNTQNKPAHYADITPWGAWRENSTYDLSFSPEQVDRFGLNGYVLPNRSTWTYDEVSGQLSDISSTSESGRSYKHILLLTDSFGNFLSSYTRQHFYGDATNEAAPSYVTTIEAVAGRQIEDIAPVSSGNTLLDELQNYQARPDAYKPGILVLQMGVNDFLRDDGNTAENVLAYTQEFINYAHDNDMIAVLSTATPFASTSVDGTYWSTAKQAELDEYNNALLNLNNGENIRVINTYDLLDGDNDDALDEQYGSGDGVHLNSAGNQLYFETYDALIKSIIAEQENSGGDNNSDSGGNGNTLIQANIKASRTECASPCTVVFSAEDTQAEGLNEHQVFGQLLTFYWDFDTGLITSYTAIFTISLIPMLTVIPQRDWPCSMATKLFFVMKGFANIK